MADPLDCALDLMRRLPPAQNAASLRQLIAIAPQLTEDLLSAVDQTLLVQRCQKTGRDFLLCDYNRDGDSHRSPWSGQYQPENLQGVRPSEALRKMEEQANDAFETYRELYLWLTKVLRGGACFRLSVGSRHRLCRRRSDEEKQRGRHLGLDSRSRSHRKRKLGKVQADFHSHVAANCPSLTEIPSNRPQRQPHSSIRS